MPRLDVYRMPSGDGPGYLLDVQSDLLEHIGTRIVVPLLPTERSPPAPSYLNPIFDVLDVPHTLVPQAMGSIPKRVLRKAVASLREHHHTITDALDRILGD